MKTHNANIVTYEQMRIIRTMNRFKKFRDNKCTEKHWEQTDDRTAVLRCNISEDKRCVYAHCPFFAKNKE